jgi:predicted nucleic acid-binding protein
MTGSTDEGWAMADTNIVVYAYDPNEAEKHRIAVELLERLSTEGRLVFSAQVFNEFSNVMLRPGRRTPLTPPRVVEVLRRLSAIGEVVPMTPALTFAALDVMPRHSLSFWDALIWAAAKENGISVIYTEDFQHSRDVESVRFLNPFIADTDV